MSFWSGYSPTWSKLLAEGLCWGEAQAAQHIEAALQHVRENSDRRGYARKLRGFLSVLEDAMRCNLVVYAWYLRFFTAALVGFVSAVLRQAHSAWLNYQTESGSAIHNVSRGVLTEYTERLSRIVDATHEIVVAMLSNTAIFSLEDAELLVTSLDNALAGLAKLADFFNPETGVATLRSMRESRDILGAAFEGEQTAEMLEASFLPGSLILAQFATTTREDKDGAE